MSVRLEIVRESFAPRKSGLAALAAEAGVRPSVPEQCRATADEDGQYCFAMALSRGTQIGAIVRVDVPNRSPMSRFEVASGSGF
jgi:hypothetical protein